MISGQRPKAVKTLLYFFIIFLSYSGLTCHIFTLQRSHVFPSVSKTLLAPRRGLHDNRRKSGQAHRSAVAGQPANQKRHVEIDVLNLNRANNAASKLCELAVQCDQSLTPFSGRLN
jgi:hypothetical protein